MSATHIEHIPARSARRAPWPEWVPERLHASLADQGITELYTHQADGANLVHTGHCVVVATATASGKSLVYQLPITTSLLTDNRHSALYLAPTKALAADQLASVTALNIPETRAASYDGDTGPAEREWARGHGRWIFTNPDMLHSGILPSHHRWSSLLRRLRYVVVDECHTYRGVFGSHVAVLLRRLRRIAARYGSEPVFVLTSATIADPAAFATQLVGTEFTVVANDGAPRGPLTFTLSQPPLVSAEPPVRRSPTAHAAHRLAELVTQRSRSLVFTRSRQAAEQVTVQARQLLEKPGASDRVAAYRAGYLPEQRRALESSLRSGELLGMAATTALELGVNITGLDAVVIAGFPGTLAGMWQQAGRAGRDGQASSAEFIARPDPLDTYLVNNPRAVFGRPVEATIVDPTNPYVLAPQLACAAHEAPLTASDLELFEGDARSAVESLEAAKLLRARPTGWHWVGRHRPNVGLRGSSEQQISIVDSETGQLLGTTEALGAMTSLHQGAVYLHQGVTYLVETLDLNEQIALIRRANPDWTTFARSTSELSVIRRQEKVAADQLELCFGDVEVCSRVTGFVRRRIGSGEVIDETPLELPERLLTTKAVWCSASAEYFEVKAADLAGSLHAAEHAAIGLLPLFATCDRWDIGGLSTASHADTGEPTIFVHDGHPGGAGFAERAFSVAPAWFSATRDAVSACTCQSGCPSCVYSPKCGNGNSPLNKAGAVTLLNKIISSLR